MKRTFWQYSLALSIVLGCDGEPPKTMGHRLENMTWQQAKTALTKDTVVVIPIGAASKEHGPHLKLNNDKLIADYFAARVLERSDVVMAPTIGMHHYPAFAEYAGSISLRLETARDVVIDVVRSLAAYGPRRFYALNTGVSTNKALEPAAGALAADGITLTFTDLKRVSQSLPADLLKQEGGTHADEKETSMMLVIAPRSVDMSKAVKDYDPRPLPGLTPKGPDEGKTYSPSGIWGDATLATKAKGKVIVDTMLQLILADIEALRAR